MKRKMQFLFTFIFALAFFCFGFTACKKDAEDVVITVENATDNQTLLSYMQSLQEEGKITFTLKNGMVTEIGGTANTTKSFWMLYTSDTENANQAWGTYVYNGETLGSAMYGAETLVVKNGETYVWTYQTF